MELLFALSAIGAAIAAGVAAAAAAIADSIVTSKYLESMTRQPEMSGKLMTNMFISVGLIEALPIVAVVVAFILLYANPLIEIAMKVVGK